MPVEHQPRGSSRSPWPGSRSRASRGSRAGRRGAGRQSKSLGHSTLNENVTRESCGSNPAARRCSPVSSSRRELYVEKSPARSVRTTRTRFMSAAGTMLFSSATSSANAIGSGSFAGSGPRGHRGAGSARSRDRLDAHAPADAHVLPVRYRPDRLEEVDQQHLLAQRLPTASWRSRTSRKSMPLIVADASTRSARRGLVAAVLRRLRHCARSPRPAAPGSGE